MINTKITSGIQKKYLRYTVALLLLAMFLSSFGVWFFVRGNIRDALIDKYAFMTEKMGILLDNFYRQSDEATAECILNDSVQKSLNPQSLNETERVALEKYFAYISLEGVADYCYVDNRRNVYGRSYSRVSYEDFKESGFEEKLGEEYSKTKWFCTEDTLFGTGAQALFIGRFVRSMDYAHSPGMLFLMMEDDFLQEIIDSEEYAEEDIVIGMMDETGQVCAGREPENYRMGEETLTDIRAFTKEDASGIICEGKRVPGGFLCVYRQGETGMLVYTFVPDQVLNGGIGRVLLIMAGIYLIVIAIAVNLSIYFSRRFAKPIREITEAMTGFDGNDFDKTVKIHTNTELDQIGSSYNEMLKNIERLLNEVKEQEKELRTSELNMLISQINPHFLYNTLDTIYMLARINKEETTMRMIQALSKYLRLSLNKGGDVVTLEDELENVKSYMEIQQIRNAELFTYEISCSASLKKSRVLKLILQPLAENAIKYGFQDIFEGGVIRIEAEADEAYLTLCVYNNGSPIEPDMLKQLNQVICAPFAEMREMFPDKKHGYGVVNIATRLRLKYGENVRFYYTSSEAGTNCYIKIPKETFEV